ncbi:Thiamine-phosphate synthase [Marinobacterium sp. xm-a-121]|uniref:thiamine phosphate synthase n=1 Tax=unclassified Marinobacterium TaxID=2644139 RepID=UPI0015690465|nr:Thiamine-phosphate synthase [Marinobacterium sp. xm-a-121]NRP99186.1 Thiamine-phosphate synthase [Marinobacterium sp. xm-v-233]
MNRLGPIYVITDTESPWSIRDQVNFAAEGGAHLIQYRDKHISDAGYFSKAVLLMKDLKGYDCELILNDRVNVAKELPQCGLHVGQSDGELAAIKASLAPTQILGLSIEHSSQINEANQQIADYFGIGPIRATQTKSDHAPPIGFDGLKDAVKQSSIPTYAIGGMSSSDIPILKSIGVSGIAVVSTVTRSDDPKQPVENLRKEWSKT